MMHKRFMRNSIEAIKRWKYRANPLIFTIPLTAWGLVLRFHYRSAHKLWVDETYQIEVCNEPFLTFVKRLPSHDFCRYLNGDYFFTYPFFKLFGMNKWGLAIPHILATFLSFVLLYLICKNYLKTSLGYLIVFGLFSWHTVLITHALEIRPYPMLVVLALAVFYLTHKIFKENFEISIRKKMWLGLFFIMVFWFHPYGILILFFITLYFLLSSPETPPFKTFFGRILPFYFFILLIAMPLWCVSVFGLHHSQSWHTIGNVFQFIPNPALDPIGFLKSVFANLVGQKKLYFLLAGLPLSFLIPHQERYKQVIFFLVLIAMPVVVILAADMKSSYWFIQRQFIWLMPLFIILLGWCWESSLLYLLKKQQT